MSAPTISSVITALVDETSLVAHVFTLLAPHPLGATVREHAR
jgi:hypothetical protein